MFTAIGSTGGADEKFPVLDVFKEFLSEFLMDLDEIILDNSG
jgi:hypothetical protein